MTEDEEVIGNDAAAELVGVKVNTWRPYVKRGQAPQPHRREVRGGHALPVWWKSALLGWKRPGRGARTDLTEKPQPDQKTSSGTRPGE